MKIIKENIQNIERSLDNDKVDAVGSMPIVMADAVYQSEKADEQVEEAQKESIEIPEIEKVIGAEKQPVPKKPEEPKMDLEESLFEDYNESTIPLKESDMLQHERIKNVKSYIEKALSTVDAYISNINESLNESCMSEAADASNNIRHYSDILFDMIEEGSVNAADIAKDLIYWCSEEDIERYMEVNQLIGEFIDDEETQEEALTEDTEEDKYYAALDIPKGPERKKVAAQRRQDFLKKYDLNDRAQEWKNAKGKDDPEEETDLFTQVNDELFPYDMEVIKLWTKFPNVPASKRYHSGDIGVDYDGNVLVYAEEDKDFEFANAVAQAYGLEITEPKQQGKYKVAKIIMPVFAVA